MSTGYPSRFLGEPVCTMQEAEPARPVPRHVAFIMDGNGRWAVARGFSVAVGHRKGAEAVQGCVRSAIRHGVRYLTLYAFSSENWRRPPEEVGNLTALLRFYLRHKLNELHEQGVQLRIIGEPGRFDPGLQQELQAAQHRTRTNETLILTLALSYGGRADIAQAVRKLAERVARGELEPESIDECAVDACLQTADLPDPDLVVRTSGECRLSNFLLWQSAYAELAFLDVLWPDFGEAEFAEVMAQFVGRKRRFGGRPQ